MIEESGDYVVDADITDNTVDVCIDIRASAVTIDGQENSILRTDSTGTAIQASAETGFIEDVTIENIHVDGWDTGILVGETAEVHNSAIRDSHVSNTGGPGIELTDDTVGISIENNLVQDNGQTGIDVSGELHILDRNEVTGSGWSGLAVWGLSHTVMNNTVEDVGASGIFVRGQDHDVTENSVTRSDSNGISVEGSTSANFERNVISGEGTTDVGVRIHGSDGTEQELDFKDTSVTGTLITAVDIGDEFEPASSFAFRNTTIVEADGLAISAQANDVPIQFNETNLASTQHALNFSLDFLELSSVTEPAALDEGMEDLGTYFEATAIDEQEAFMNLSLVYEDEHVLGSHEDTLAMWRHDSAEWDELEEASSLDTETNTLRADLDEFSVFAPQAESMTPVCEDVSYETDGEGNLEVDTLEQLQCIGDEGTNGEPDDNYVLTNEIDASETAYWNGLEKFSEEFGSSFSGADEGEQFELSYPAENVDEAIDMGDESPVDVTIIDNEEGIIQLEEDTEGELNVIYSLLDPFQGFDPINGFEGSFNGQNHEIQGLFINRGDEDGVGLFGENIGGVIGYVSLVGGNIRGDWGVGGVVGENEDGLVHESSATGTVTGSFSVGGLVGGNLEGIVRDSYATGNVSGESQVGGLTGVQQTSEAMINNSYATGNVTGERNVGGLLGRNGAEGPGGPVSNSYASGNVTGDSAVGGLLGHNEDAMISDASASGAVTGTDEVGGLIGSHSGVTISETTATGPVTGSEDVGGLVGANKFGGTIEESTATGNITGTSDVGGLIGLNRGTANESYATGTVTGTRFVGGLIGLQGSPEASINNSYATGNVTGERGVGGLLGRNGVEDGGTVRNSSATGTVTGEDEVGGLIGYNLDEVSNTSASGTVTGINEVGGLIGLNGGPIANSSATGTVEGESGVGALVGMNGRTVTESMASGDVDGIDDVGGLIGFNGWGAVVRDSIAMGNVNGSSSVGGFIGSTSLATVERSLSLGSVSGSDEVGGFVGASTGLIEVSAAVGTVEGEENVGGFAGYQRNTQAEASAMVQNVRASGDVDGTHNVGGLIGFNDVVEEEEAVVVTSFSTGTVTGETHEGGLVGQHTGSISESYWDTDTSSASDPIGEGSDDGVTGLGTEEMTGLSPEDTMVGFQFDSVWAATDSYPFHQWMITDLTFTLDSATIDVEQSTAGVVDLSMVAGLSVTATETSTYESDDPAVATIDSGVVDGESEGEATLSATLVGEDTASITVEAVETDEPEPEPEPTEPDFEIASVTSNSPLDPGETAVVDAQITNAGDGTGTQTIEFNVSDQTANESVTIAPGNSELVSFEWETTAEEIGSHTATVASEDDVANTTISVTADQPAYVSAHVADATPAIVDITFDQAVSVDEAVPTDGFAVSLDGSQVDLETASADGTDVALELAQDVDANQDILLSYDGDSNNVMNEHDLEALAFETGDIDNQVEPFQANLSAIDPTTNERSNRFSIETTVAEGVILSAEDSVLPPGQEATFDWEVGDESFTTTEPTLDRQFFEPGVYNASVTVTVGDRIRSALFTLEVVDETPPDARLTAAETVGVGEDPNLDASESSDNVAIADFEWDFGDGTTESGANLTQPEHAFDEPGEYEVTVTVTDTSGNSAQNSTTITVEEEPDEGMDVLPIGLALLVVAAIGVAGYWYMRRR